MEKHAWSSHAYTILITYLVLRSPIGRLAGVIGYTVRPNFRSGGPYSLREYGPPRTKLPREYGPSKIVYIQGIQSGGGGGLNSLTEWRFDFDTEPLVIIASMIKRRNRFLPKSQPFNYKAYK